MNLNCLSEIFSFNCRKKKKRSDIKRDHAEDSDTEALSNCTLVSNIENSIQQDDNFDIIDSYSKSNNTKTKIKKTVQLVNKNNKNNSAQKLNSSEFEDFNCSSPNPDTQSRATSKNNSRRKVNITKERTLKESSTSSAIEELAESLKNLNTKKKEHKLTKLTDRVKVLEKKKASEIKPFLQKSTISDQEEVFSTSVSMSSITEHKNTHSEAILKRINKKDKYPIDSDSEIWFLKNKNENTKFNYNLKKKMLEYLTKKSSK